MIRKIILCILIISVPNIACSEPSVDSISGNFQHGKSITISGVQFRTKAPAQPLLWDDCSSNLQLSENYDAYKPKNAQQGDYYNIKYRGQGFRNVEGPNERTNYYIAGAHAMDSSSNTDERGGNVCLGKNMNSQKYFISYYYRLDPKFDEEANTSSGDNMKELVLSSVPGQFYPDGDKAFGFANWCINTVPDKNYTSGIRISRMPIESENQSLPYSCSQDQYVVYHNNPVKDWVHMQWEGVFNDEHDAPQISLTTYPDGSRTYRSHYGGGLTTYEYYRGEWVGYPKKNDLRFIGIGGFARVPRENNGTNSFRYFAAIYIDNTLSRVMLGNNKNYNECTIMEPQIPTAWSDESITVKVNLGSLPDVGMAYIFVFDADNNYNQSGYPVNLGGNEQPPAPPENLRIID